jgi:hypothetical protein
MPSARRQSRPAEGQRTAWPRANYHPNYYAAFVVDPDRHNVEAVTSRPALLGGLGSGQNPHILDGTMNKP